MNEFKYKLLTVSMTLFTLALMIEMNNMGQTLNRAQSDNITLRSSLDRSSNNLYKCERRK